MVMILGASTSFIMSIMFEKKGQPEKRKQRRTPISNVSKNALILDVWIAEQRVTALPHLFFEYVYQSIEKH